jgi:hypothetical protein
MTSRISRILALTGISAALAIGGAGVAQASPDHGGHRNDPHCKKLHGKKKRDCERRHHHR